MSIENPREDLVDEITDDLMHAVGRELEKRTGRNPVTDLIATRDTEYLIGCMDDYVRAVLSELEVV